MMLYRIKGICLVPHEVEMVISADNEVDAEKKARNSWMNYIDPCGDRSSAFDFNGIEVEPYTKNK